MKVVARTFRGVALLAALAVPLSGASRAPRLTVARLQYDGGGDWYANPSSIPNLLTAIRERTSLPVEKTEARVTLMDDKLWDYPFIHMTGHGNVKFTDAEVVRRSDAAPDSLPKGERRAPPGGRHHETCVRRLSLVCQAICEVSGSAELG